VRGPGMSARVLLMRLSCRTSSKGTEYLSGFLGCARLVAFKGKEPDKFGNSQWEVYLSEPEPRDGQRQQPTRGQSTWDASRDHERHDTRTRAAQAGEAILEHAPGRRFEPDPEIPF
jgi:hypothetical protein